MNKEKAKGIADEYEFNKILTSISNACTEGKYEITVGCTLKEKEKLELLGYTVSPTTMIPCGYYGKENSCPYVVSWK